MRRVALFCVGALFAPYMPEIETDLPFTYTIYPCFAGEVGTIDCKIDTSAFPSFYYYLCHYDGTHYVYDTCVYASGNGEKIRFSLPIPSSLTSLGSFDIEFGFQDNDPRIPSPSHYMARIAKTLTVADHIEDRLILGDTSVSTNRWTYVYDENNTEEEQVLVDSYRFEGFSVPANENTRLFGFSNIKIHYETSGGQNLESLVGKIELRLLNHIDEFAGVGEAVGNAYRSIQLRLVEREVDESHYEYGIKLSSPLYYSKKDYTIQSGGEGTFSSYDLYIPLRQGHDTDAYRYQIFLRELTRNDDSFRIEGSSSYARRYFGSHPDAEYGVFIGGNEDA